MKTSNIYRKHLTLSDRIRIEGYLNEARSLKDISELVGKSYKTIYNEIKKRRELSEGNVFNKMANNDPNCIKTSKTPFVCNGCSKRRTCRKNKFHYIAEDAHRDYKELLSAARWGINMNPVEFAKLKEIVRENISRGHSFYMIKYYHNLPVCVKTLYNYQDKGYFEIPNIDLPRKVRYKPRKKNENKEPRNTKHRKGRTYQDFIQYKKDFFEEYEYDVEVVLMDTVEGIKGEGESVLLTLLFTSSNFLMAFKMDRKTVACVNKVFKYLKVELGASFSELFPVILTDNGSEFSDPDTIEDNGLDMLKTRMFYCDPNRSDQKGKIEVAHEYIRRFIPKGASFNKYSQKDITLMINHINSVCRDLFKGHSPYQLQGLFSGTSWLEKLGFEYIEHNKIVLSNKLFKQKDTK